MKNDGHSGNENAEGLDARDDAALWDLLGQAAHPKAGPYFARRVLREVSLQAETHAASWWQPAALWRACRRLPRLAFVAGTPAAALLLLFLGLRVNAPIRRTPLATPAAVAEPAARPPGAAPALVTDEDIVAALTADEPSLAPAAEENDATAPAPGTAPAAAPSLGVTASGLPEGISEQDVEVIAELDTLREREQNRLWTEDSARF